jgi:hypothetical protein
MVFIADDLGAWLVGLLADAGRKKLTMLVLGSDQERAVRNAATGAVRDTASEMNLSAEQTRQLAMTIKKAFHKPIQGARVAGPVTMLELLQGGIAGQLATLDGAGRTATRQSSMEMLGVPGAVLAEKVSGYLVRELIFRGSGGGPLAPLADQLNHDLTHLQGQRVEGMLARLVSFAITAPGPVAGVAGPAHWLGSARPAGAVRVSAADVRRLGVHAAISVPGVADDIPPEYVARDADAAEFGVRAKVAAAAKQGGFVLLVGGSSVGKTRCAIETVKELLPDWWLVHPARAAEVAALRATSTPLVVWLDELQRYLGGERGLTGALVRDLLNAPQPVVIIGTLWPNWYNSYIALPAPGGADPFAREREVLDLAAVVRIDPEFSPAEQGRARAAAQRDPRLRVALGAHGYGLTQTLAAAPQLVARWDDAKTASPYSWAVLTAALDVVRLGTRAPLSADLLRAAAVDYCTSQQRANAPADWFDQALAYATTKLHGAAAALSAAGAGMGQVMGYTVADYLIQYASQERRYAPVPASTWDAVVSHTRDPADATRLASSAGNRMLNRYAIPLYHRAADAGDEGAANVLATLLTERGDLDGAIRILRVPADGGDAAAQEKLARLLDSEALRARADAGDQFAARFLARYCSLDELRARASKGEPAAATRLADVLARNGDLDEAADILRAVADTGNKAAAGQLAGLLFKRRDLVGLLARADKGDEAAADLLAKLLASSGDLDGLRARADNGDRFAARQLAKLLADRGDLDGAVQVLHAPADSGDPFAADHLAGLLVDGGHLDALRARADNGDKAAARRLNNLLASSGDLDGLRARADNGDQEAAARLAGMLVDRDELDEATRILLAWTDSDRWAAPWSLTTRLTERGDIDRLRALAEAGSQIAALRLADFLAERGDIEGLRTMADSGDYFASRKLVDVLAGLLVQQGQSDKAEQLRRDGLTPNITERTHHA